MKAISKLSTTTKVLLVGGLAAGTYFVVKGLRKPEAKKLPAISPSGLPSGGALPPPTPIDDDRPPRVPAPPSIPYDPALQDVEPGMVNAYHAQWLAGNLEDRLRSALGDTPSESAVVNVLTDWAYKDVYGDGVYPIPNAWDRQPAWIPYAHAWQRMRGQMKRMVEQTLNPDEVS